MREITGRLASLDAFRGFTIAAMVLVNDPGDWSSLCASEYVIALCSAV
jgi:predicted acyltransferase